MMTISMRSFVKFIAALLILTLLNACKSLPTTPHLPKSQAISAASEALHTHAYNATDGNAPFALATSPLRVFSEQATAHPQLSGYYPIATGADAFAARSTLTRLANATIDVQYYIWHVDEAGQLMLQDLWAAAERGVKVRLLLDDFNSDVRLDTLLLAFAQHPNITVRLANPAAYRKLRALNFINAPLRINQRMHNKSMTFDNHISIIGGRNIGNEYLHANEDNQFADSDILLIGKIVPQIYHSFNAYWHASFSYDIETLVQSDTHPFCPSDYPFTDFYANAEPASSHPVYRAAVTDTDIGARLARFHLPFRYAPVYLVADHPSKFYKKDIANDYLIQQLRMHFGRPTTRFSMISSYFAPTKDGVKDLIDLAQSGVSVALLTNSYAATDVVSVHAGYAHWRRDLLKAGIKLYESKPNAVRAYGKIHHNNINYKTSLHSKIFAVDDAQVYIGSYNIDPRSANLNSEIGVVIYDAVLAKHLHESFDDKLLSHAYAVHLNGENLEWHTLEDGKLRIYTQEPNMGMAAHLSNSILSLLPIDGLL